MIFAMMVALPGPDGLSRISPGAARHLIPAGHSTQPREPGWNIALRNHREPADREQRSTHLGGAEVRR